MRTTRTLTLLALLLAIAAAIGWRTTAQAQEEEEKSRFVRFVEQTISTPDRQISLGRIEGALSSDVRISDITIADAEGVWLRINNVHLVWNRSALLRGKLDIELLEADSIVVERPPLPAQGATDTDFQIPELPVALEIDRLVVPRVELGAPVLGKPAVLAVEGSAELEDGALDANLEVERLGPEGGSLVVQANYSNETERLELGLRLSEPENGVVANLLNLRDRPAITFTIDGSGPLSDFEAEIALVAGGEPLLQGAATISRVEDGYRFVADVNGALEGLVPPGLAQFFADSSQLVIDATRSDTGAITIRRADLNSGVLSLGASASLAPDGFPTALELEARLGASSPERVVLPFADGAVSVDDARLTASFGQGETWSAVFDLAGFRAGATTAERVQVTAEGRAENLADPAARRITFEAAGQASGLASADPEIARALGDAVEFAASGAWASGERVSVTSLRLENENAQASFEGRIGAEGAEGRYRLATEDLALLSGFAGQDLAGAVDLAAEGTLGFGGTFALDLDGTARNLDLGIEALRGVLQGRTTLAGGAVRTPEGFRFDELVLENPQARVQLDGAYGRETNDLAVEARLADVSALTDRASGAVNLEASVQGEGETPSVVATLTGDDLTLSGRRFTDATARFDGRLAGSDITGDVTLSGSLDGVPVEASTRITSLEDGTRRLEALTARAGEARASGDLILRPDGLASGALSLNVPDLSTVAPLLLTDASGAIEANVSLAVEDGDQSADVTARLADVAYQNLSIGSADVAVQADNVFSAPLLSGRVAARDVTAGALVVEALDATFDRQGDTTRFETTAELAQGTLSASGALTARDGAYDVALEMLRLQRGTADAALTDPVTITFEDGALRIPGARLSVGDGRVVVSGVAGDTLDLDAEVEAFPLDIVNSFAPDLDFGGTVSGTLEASGTAAEPVIGFRLSGEDVSAAPLARNGIDQLDVDAEGRFAHGTLALTRAIADIGEGRVRAFGSIGDVLDLAADLENVPLSVANAVRPDLGLGGTVSGTVNAQGSLATPRATFEVRGDDVTARVLREAGIEALDVAAEGRFADGTVTLIEASTTIDGGRVTASGSIGETLDLTADVQDLPLAIANAVRPDLGLEGTVSGTVDAEGSLADPRATFDVTGRNVSARVLREAGVGPLDVDAAGTFADGTVTLSRAATTIDGGRVTASGSIGEVLDVTAEVENLPLAIANAARPDLGLQGSVSGTVQAEGSLDAPRATFDLTGRNVSARLLREAGVGPLTLDAAGTFADGTATLSEATATVDGGRIALSGSIGEVLDVTADLDGLPLAIANAARPDLGLQGTVSGRVAAEGSLDEPRATFDVTGRNVSARVLREAGVGPLTVEAQGGYADGTVTLTQASTTIDGGRVTASGSIGEVLDLTAEFDSLPLSLVNAVRPGLGLEGTVSGTVQAEGSLADPNVTFDLTGRGISADALREAGIGALNVDAQGRLADGSVALTARAQGPDGLTLRAEGTVPLDGSGLDISVTGTAPLTLADRFLAGRGARLTGALQVDARITGSLADPRITGRITAEGAGFIDPETGVQLRNISLAARLEGDRIVIERLTAASGQGTVAVTGSIGFAPGAGFPADLAITLRNARYEDGRLVAATLDGDLTFTGPLTGQPVLGGTINVDRAEITVPERLGGGAVLIDVEHLYPPLPVARTLALADLDAPDDDGAAGGTPTGIVLDLTVNAPDEIFVRGRGIDAELGGSVTLRGPVSEIRPVGAFELIRGRLDILGQRITFDSGLVTLVGDLDPLLDFVATTQGEGITVTATVSGRASDPRIAFSSDPELPEDEVLAQFLFGRSLDDLSPVQIARLAAALATMRGGEGTDVLGRLRRAAGLDDLDIVADEGGGVAVQAGRYINENVYLGVRAGATAESSAVTIDLDITDNLKARGELGAGGRSKLGIYFEKDY
jgi:translocation and assembly module TamB